MARKSTTAGNKKDVVDDAALENGVSALAAVSANAANVAQIMNYDLPYNQVRIVQEARFYMGQSAEAMLEAGKRFILLKENEPHGEFVSIVEDQLGIPARTARQMMQAAIKYLTNPALSSKAQAFSVLGKSKMFELMTLDTDDLVELAEGGSVANLKLDEIDRMSVRELKKALREAHDVQASTEKVLTAKNKKLDKLASELERKKSGTPAAEWVWQPVRQQLLETSEAMANYAQTELRRALKDIEDLAGSSGELIPEDIDTLRGQVLATVMQTLVSIQKDFNLAVELDTIVVPEWMRDSAPIPATAKKK